MQVGGGKSSGSTTQIPTLSPEQNAQIAAQTGLFTGTIAPAFQSYATGAQNLYNQQNQGVVNAAQGLAGIANQATNVLGTTGESALRTGVTGLQNLFTPEYEAQQLQAALQPAQAQYAQNVAGQQAQFGGMGQLGSARSALAGQQLAGSNMAAQQQAAAQVSGQIAQQRAGAASNLISAGQGGLGQAIGAQQQTVNAGMVPFNVYTQLGQQLGLISPSSYTPDFRGTQGYTSNTTGSQTGAKLGITPNFG
jgi:DNA-binding phage protein